ncbi:MAG: TonB-dependent receptor [Bryobacteraceae bacterium]
MIFSTGPLAHRLLAIFILAPALPWAQPVPQAEPTVITVTGQATPLSATSASVVVVTRQVIEDSHAENVVDILRQVSFLFVTQSGARGSLTTITLRGGKPNFTVVLYDGIPINDITDVLGGSYDFSTMSTDGIEQIEIVRGPLSSMYGSDAIAGVINIIPRRGEGKPLFEVGGALGNFLTRDVSSAASGKTGNLDYSFAGSYLDIGPQVAKDPYSLGTAGINSHLTLGNDKLLSFVVRYQNAETGGFPPGGGGPEFSILRQAQAVHTIELITGVGFQHQVNPTWLYGLNFDLFDRTQNSNVPALLDAIPPTYNSVPAEITDTNFKRYRFSFTNTLRLSPNFSAEIGAGWMREQGISTGVFDGAIPDNFTLTRDTADANAVIDYTFRGLTATAGIRVDKTTDFRAVYSPSAGISYRFTPKGPRLKANWGRGFKTPSFYSLADKVVGNPLLKPEFSRSYDIGVENDFLRGRLRAELTVFRNSYADLIDFSALTFRLVNRSQARTQGSEFAVTAPLNSRLELRAYASYLAWRLMDTTEPLRDIPHWQSGGGITWKIKPRWHSQADILAVGRRYDFEVPVPLQQTVGGYSTASLATSYEFSDELTGSVRIDNLFNQQYHEYIGFPNPGVYLRAGITYRFR